MKNNKSGLIVFIIVIIIASASSFLGFRTTPSKKSFKQDRESVKTYFEKKSKEGYIAALYIEGVIQKEGSEYNQKWLLKTIKDLKTDPQNKGIAIYVNSPGGTVYEADEVYLALQNYKTTGKKIYVYQGNLAASGGYYISCAGEKIYANRNTLTGSIGVITGSSFDVTGLFDKIGIKSMTVTAGKNKNMFNYNQPVTAEQKAIMQSIADECYDQFTYIVSGSRNININDVKKIADGRIYTAKQALNNGLIDAIGSWDNMIGDMKRECFDGKELNIIEYHYKKDASLREYILGSVFGKGETKAFDNIINKASLQYPAYLWE